MTIDVMWVQELTKPDWMIAVNKGSGQVVHNRITFRVLGTLMRPNVQENQVVMFEFSMPEGGAEQLIEGLQEVLSTPPPQGFDMPGMN